MVINQYVLMMIEESKYFDDVIKKNFNKQFVIAKKDNVSVIMIILIMMLN